MNNPVTRSALSTIARLGLLAGLLLLGSATRACGEDQPALDQPLLYLLDVYQTRCETEIRHLSEKLTDLNRKAEGELQSPSNPSLFDGVRKVWLKGADARALFGGLVAAADRYTRWAGEAKLPQGFGVPQERVDSALRGKRWESLRVLLLPKYRRASSLGWGDLPGDAEFWRSTNGRSVELLLLLHWLGEPPTDALPFDEPWVSGEVSADQVVQWQSRVQQVHRYLHGEYEYHELQAPPLSGFASRPLAVLPTLCWPSGSKGDAVALLAFAAGKEKFLQHLLALIEQCGGRESAAVDWFCAAARTFPVQTALSPELFDGTLRVVGFRAGDDPNNSVRETVANSPRRSLHRMQAANWNGSVVARLTAAVYWYQFQSVTPDGKSVAPLLGWTTWTPRTGVVESATEPMAPISFKATDSNAEGRTASGSAATSVGSLQVTALSTAPPEAWREICLQMGRLLADDTRVAGSSVSVSVDPSCQGWILAFGADELAATLNELPSFHGRVAVSAADSDPNVRHVHVAVVELQPNQSMRLLVSIDGVPAATILADIPDPWPHWFAAWTLSRLQMLAAGATIAGLFLLRVFWRVLRQPVDRLEQVFFLSASAALVLSGLLLEPPTPEATGEIGGTIVFEYPVDAAVPEPQRPLYAAATLALCEQLADQTTPPDPPPVRLYEWRDWLSRVVSDLKRLLLEPNLIPSPNAVQRDGPFKFRHLRYRIVGYAWNRRQVLAEGPLVPSELPVIRRALEQVDWHGERSWSPSLTDASPAPANLRVTLTDGDYGGISPTKEFRAKLDEPHVTLCALGPSRDRNDGRQLLAAERLHAIASRCDFTQCVVASEDGSRFNLCPASELQSRSKSWVEIADASADRAQDMQAAADAWWLRLSEKDAQQLGEDFASQTIDIFLKTRKRTSRTALTCSFDPRLVCGLLILTAVLMCLPLAVARPGVGATSDARRLCVRMCWGAGCLVVVLCWLVQTDSTTLFVYGVSVAEASHSVATWAELAMFGVVVGVAALWLLDRGAEMQPSEPTWTMNHPPPARWVGLRHVAAVLSAAAGAVLVLSVPVSSSASGNWSWLPSAYGWTQLLGLGCWSLGLTIGWARPPGKVSESPT